jgi:hypothetical protein
VVRLLVGLCAARGDRVLTIIANVWADTNTCSWCGQARCRYCSGWPSCRWSSAVHSTSTACTRRATSTTSAAAQRPIGELINFNILRRFGLIKTSADVSPIRMGTQNRE